MKLELVIRSISIWGHPDIRTWQPDDPGKVAEIVSLDIGERTKESCDTFSIRVATPAGLSTLQARKGIIAIRPLLVMQRYDLADLRRWLRHTVTKCEGENWTACVNNLRLYFDWEYEGYKEV